MAVKVGSWQHAQNNTDMLIFIAIFANLVLKTKKREANGNLNSLKW